MGFSSSEKWLSDVQSNPVNGRNKKKTLTHHKNHSVDPPVAKLIHSTTWETFLLAQQVLSLFLS
jgi:hypothetical protein